jgi:hypothetical protein
MVVAVPEGNVIACPATAMAEGVPEGAPGEPRLPTSRDNSALTAPPEP